MSDELRVLSGLPSLSFCTFTGVSHSGSSGHKRGSSGMVFFCRQVSARVGFKGYEFDKWEPVRRVTVRRVCDSLGWAPYLGPYLVWARMNTYCIYRIRGRE